MTFDIVTFKLGPAILGHHAAFSNNIYLGLLDSVGDVNDQRMIEESIIHVVDALLAQVFAQEAHHVAWMHAVNEVVQSLLDGLLRQA